MGYIGAPVATDADITNTFKSLKYFIDGKACYKKLNKNNDIVFDTYVHEKLMISCKMMFIKIRFNNLLRGWISGNIL